MKKKLILLHNGFDNARTWSPVIPFLEEEFEIVAYDREGYGLRFDPNHYQDPQDLVEEGVEELIEIIDQQTAADEQVFIWGHCVGGAIALVYAARYPQKVQALLGEAVGFFSDHALSERAIWFQDDFETIPLKYKNHFIGLHGAINAPILWERIKEHRSSYILNPRYSILEEIENLTIPCLLLQGDRDLYFDENHLKRAEMILQNAETKILEGTHELHSQDPKAISSLAIQFFTQNSL